MLMEDMKETVERERERTGEEKRDEGLWEGEEVSAVCAGLSLASRYLFLP
jgi:hypothetical protein